MRRVLLLVVSVTLLALPVMTAAPVFANDDKAAKEDQGKDKALGHDEDGSGPPQGKARGHSKSKDKSKSPSRGQAKGKTRAKSNNGKAKGHAKAKAKGHGPSGKTTICHSTGSATKPFVKITISNNALDAHRRHHDGRDIVPAPAGDCPAAAAQTATAGMQVPDSQVTVLGEQASGAAGPKGEVLGETASGGSPALRVAGADASAATGSLPFTGSDVLVIVLAGLAGLLGGFALRRSVLSRRGI